jgi:hypothetical protein
VRKHSSISLKRSRDIEGVFKRGAFALVDASEATNATGHWRLAHGGYATARQYRRFGAIASAIAIIPCGVCACLFWRLHLQRRLVGSCSDGRC